MNYLFWHSIGLITWSAYLVCLMFSVDCLIGLGSCNIINKRWGCICEYVSCGPGQSSSCKEAFWLGLPYSVMARSSAASCFQAYYGAVPLCRCCRCGWYDIDFTCALMMWRCCSQALQVANLMPIQPPMTKVYLLSVTIARSLTCLYRWASHELPNNQYIMLDKSAAW